MAEIDSEIIVRKKLVVDNYGTTLRKVSVKNSEKIFWESVAKRDTERFYLEFLYKGEVSFSGEDVMSKLLKLVYTRRSNAIYIDGRKFKHVYTVNNKKLLPELLFPKATREAVFCIKYGVIRSRVTHNSYSSMCVN